MIGKSTHPSPPAIELARQPGVVIIDDDTELNRAIACIPRAKYNCLVIGSSAFEAFLAELDKGDRRGFLEENLDLIIGISGDGEAHVLTDFKNAGVNEIFSKPLGRVDYGTVAAKTYRVCSGIDSSVRPRPKIFTKYI